MNLQEIKDQVSKERGYTSWDSYQLRYNAVTNELWPEVCRRACEETGRLTLEKAAENAKMIFHDGYFKKDSELFHFQSGSDNLKISKSSITDPSNIVIPE